MIIAGTGHRPEKLGGYSDQVFKRLHAVAIRWLEDQEARSEGVVEYVIMGMALGWDQALGCAAFDLRIPYDAYVPFKGQETRWPIASQQRYKFLLSKAREVKYICEGGYAGWKMQKRNVAMVDACTDVLALWDGSLTGGTFNCITYAHTQGKPVINVWKKFIGQT